MSSYSSVSSNSSSTAHGGGTAAAAAAAKLKAKQALAQYHNERVPRYYFTAIGGLIVLFTIFHWSRYLYSQHALKGSRESTVRRCQVAVARQVGQDLLRCIINEYLDSFETYLYDKFQDLLL
jgi:hypothetical protein